MDAPELLTIDEAAHRAGVSVATMRRRAASGQVRASKPGKEWLVEASSVASKRPLPRAAGRLASRGSPRLDFRQALVQVRSRDLVEEWVPDVVRHEDELANAVRIHAAAAERVAAVGPFDAALEVEAAKTPFLSRPAVLLSVTDRVAFHAVVASALPRIENQLSPAVYSARASADSRYLLLSGTEQWVKWQKEVAKAISEGFVWMVRTDISGYFENIQHRILFAEFDALGPDPDVAAALKRMLGSWATVAGRGLPQGPDVARVLGNLYLIPVDQVMTAGPWRYLRYQDDIRVLAQSRRDAVEGMRQLQRETRLRGLMLSSDKTAALVADAARASTADAELDAAQYWATVAPSTAGRRVLRRILRRALGDGGRVDGRRARFSLYRLWRLRDSAPLKIVLQRFEDLAPLGSLGPQYLLPFLNRPSVQRRVTAFLEDGQRNTSAFLSTWLLAAMMEQGISIPDEWVVYARRIAANRNQPSYHRAIAANVMGARRRAADITWLKDAVKFEYEPAMLRAYLVALTRADELEKDVINIAVGRLAALQETVDYLRGRSDLPSLIDPHARVALARRNR